MNILIFNINYSLSESGAQIFLTLNEVMKVLHIAVPVAALLALLWTAWQLKEGKKFGLPLIMTIALAAVSVCIHVAVKYRADGISMLYWLVIAWAVLAMVFYIYQREFFVCAVLSAMGLLGVYVIPRAGISAVAAYGYAAVCAAAVAAIRSGYCDADAEISVRLPGGELVIRYADGTVYLTGEAHEVFRGTVRL